VAQGPLTRLRQRQSKTAHAEVLTALHPSLMVAFKAQAEREAALVKETQLSTQVAIARPP